jgi:hypothetical protein
MTEAFVVAQEMFTEHQKSFAEFLEAWTAPVPQGLQQVIDMHVRGATGRISTEDMIEHVKKLYEDSLQEAARHPASAHNQAGGAGSKRKHKDDSIQDKDKDKDGKGKRKRGSGAAGIDAIHAPLADDPMANTRRTLKTTTETEIIFNETGSDVQPLYESRGGVCKSLQVYEALPDDSVTVTTLDNLAEILPQLRPSFVVVFDPDIALTRMLEVYKSDNPSRPLRVYFLSYSHSVEEQRYLSEVRRETEAFEQLIETKARMVVDTSQDGKTGDIVTVHADAPMPTTSRKGGAAAKRRVRVIVDVREFRSALPSLLHKKGMEIVPVTLQVCVCMYAFVCVSMDVCVCVCVYVCMCMCLYVCVCADMHVLVFCVLWMHDAVHVCVLLYARVRMLVCACRYVCIQKHE